jgi:large subunit ribosomal protein L35
MASAAKKKSRTCKSASKRFKLKANGTVIFRRAKRAHILSKETPKIKRQRRRNQAIKVIADAKRIKRLLGELS